MHRIVQKEGFLKNLLHEQVQRDELTDSQELQHVL